MTSVQILGLFGVAGLLVQTSVLWLAVRLWRMPRQSLCRVALVMLAQIALGVGMAAAILVPAADLSGPGILLVYFGIQGVATIQIMRWAFGGRPIQVVGAWLFNLVIGTVAGLGLVFVLKQFVETYQAQSSSMSPSVRGFHVVETLADGTHLIVGANPPGDPTPVDTSGAIVAETFESREVPRPRIHTETADRVLCNRTRSPERWDAVVFRHPDDRARISVKRLVGLPGEKVEVRDGAVWIDGTRQTPPDRLGPIRYTPGFACGGGPPPALERHLGPDEFFVLGDNPERSSDSRHWGPVPRANVIGVVDAICWPPGRWQRDP